MSALLYRYFDASAAAFPPPRVPLLPCFRTDSIGADAGGRFESIAAGRRQQAYKRGRYALLAAYRLCGLDGGSTLLAPAYHCRTMLDPAIRLGAGLSLYPVDEQLAPDLDALRSLIGHARQPIRALLLTHYFGFPQAAAPVRALCDEHGIALIEDCSHALFNPARDGRLARHGRYAVASPYKLLPCEEGGLLIAGDAAAALPAPPRPASWRDEARVLLHAAQHARDGRHKRRAIERPAAQADGSATAGPPGRVHSSPSDATSQLYVAGEEDQAGATSALWLARLCGADRAAQARRSNYRRWLDAVAALPHCRALFPALADDVVPYMFPLAIDRPERDFDRLKRRGMPIWRWDEMAVSDCAVSQRYSHHLLHLPCHQALSEAELDWMVQAVAEVVGATDQTFSR